MGWKAATDKTKLHKEFSLYESQQSEKCSLKKLVFDKENSQHQLLLTNKGPFEHLDLVYTMQHQQALRWLVEFIFDNPTLSSVASGCMYGLDVGSSMGFVSHMASFTGFLYLDAALPAGEIEMLHDANMGMCGGEAQELNFPDDKFPIVTSLHAIEHFGLGRYGDSIDAMGDIRGVRELHRVLHPGGIFIGAVPIIQSGMEHVKFNINRLYSIKSIKSLLVSCGFDIAKELCVLAPLQGVIKELPAPDGHGPPIPPQKTCACLLTPEQFENTMKKVTCNDCPPDAVYMWVGTKKLCNDDTIESSNNRNEEQGMDKK